MKIKPLKVKPKRPVVAVGTVMLIPSVLNAFIFNFNAGTLMTVAASCAVIAYGVFFEPLVKKRWLTCCIAAACTALMAILLSLYLYGSGDNATYEEDVVIVLGNAVRGERVSPTLAGRLDAAFEYHRRNPRALIVTTGGQGPQEDIPEALAMARYLVDRGVPAELIIKEGESSTTYENLLFSKALLGEIFEGSYTAVIVTNEFHVFRAERYAEALGYDVTHLNAPTKWYTVPMNYLREILAIVKMWFVIGSGA